MEDVWMTLGEVFMQCEDTEDTSVLAESFNGMI